MGVIEQFCGLVIVMVLIIFTYDEMSQGVHTHTHTHTHMVKNEVLISTFVTNTVSVSFLILITIMLHDVGL